MLMLSIVMLVIGLALLGYAADQLVTGSARLALAFRLSAVLVGAVIIGFGTSTPELLITALAGVRDAGDIAAGNLVGSNVANLALVAGVTALITPLFVSSRTLRREVPLSAGSVVLFAVMIQGGLSRIEGVILLLALFVVIGLMIRGGRDEDDPLGQEASEVATTEFRPRTEATRTALALVATIVAAQLVVSGAEGIAGELSIREGFVGLTLVAVGTSLPELVTAIQAARRGYADLIVGNLLGSNIFNSLAGGGLLALVAPGPFSDPDIAGLATAFMVILALAAAVMLATGRKLVRWEAAVLLCVYLAVLPFLAR